MRDALTQKWSLWKFLEVQGALAVRLAVIETGNVKSRGTSGWPFLVGEIDEWTGQGRAGMGHDREKRRRRGKKGSCAGKEEGGWVWKYWKPGSLRVCESASLRVWESGTPVADIDLDRLLSTAISLFHACMPWSHRQIAWDEMKRED